MYYIQKTLVMAVMMLVMSLVQTANSKNLIENTGIELSLSSPKGRMYVSPVPDSVENTGKAIILCPGGRYARLAIGGEGFEWMDYFNKLGITAVVLKYTMPAGNPSKPVADAEEAIRILRTKGKQWGVNPEKIGIMGFSAGGHLASFVATNAAPDVRPNFQCLIYPVITMDTTFTHLPSRENLIGANADEATVVKYSNEKNVTAETPPAFIAAAANDVRVPAKNAISYFYALNDKNVAASLHIYPTGGHGWGFKNTKFKHYPELLRELEAWLNER